LIEENINHSGTCFQRTSDFNIELGGHSRKIYPFLCYYLIKRSYRKKIIYMYGKCFMRSFCSCNSLTHLAKWNRNHFISMYSFFYWLKNWGELRSELEISWVLNWSTLLSMIKIYNPDFRVWVWSLSTEYVLQKFYNLQAWCHFEKNIYIFYVNAQTSLNNQALHNIVQKQVLKRLKFNYMIFVFWYHFSNDKELFSLVMEVHCTCITLPSSPPPPPMTEISHHACSTRSDSVSRHFFEWYSIIKHKSNGYFFF
jgi:hypothetical protein